MNLRKYSSGNFTHTITMASITNSNGIFTQVYDFLFGSSKGPETEPRRILCTGKWREFSSRRALLQAALNHPVTALSQEDEGVLQAQCAHRIMKEEGYINSSSEHAVYLYLGAGRGSTQFTALDEEGEYINAFNVETGYPKSGEPNIALLRETAAQIHEAFGDTVDLIVGFDSIFHVLKKTRPVVKDESALADATPTTGKDFIDLGYLTDLYPDTDMFVVRNFITSDGNLRKITFATGDELLIDLGSGNANLVDPTTGQQLETRELPADWMTDDNSLLEVSKALRELLDAADRAENDDSSSEEEETDDECSQCEDSEHADEEHADEDAVVEASMAAVIGN